jgi:hypothetical protein
LYIIFANDIVLIKENLEEVNNRLDKWRLALEGKGLRISRNITEYIEYDLMTWACDEARGNKCSKNYYKNER